ncbi:MAG: HU family DNA-binding protein [Tannerellaceae bacterium]|nr:HU family DNA-binding protein [Tannerellaceae bacterium]
MSVTYRVVGQRMMAGPDSGQKKYFGRVVRNKMITHKQLCKRIALQSSATRGDVSLILDNLVDALLEYMQSGHSVNVPNLGIFRVTAGSEGVESEEDFKAHHMKKARINFLPCADVKAEMERIGFERDIPFIKTVVLDEPCELEHM